MLTMDQIKAMSDEEVAAMNKKLGKKVLRNFLLLFAAKWIVIIGSVRLARKLLNSSKNN